MQIYIHGKMFDLAGDFALIVSCVEHKSPTEGCSTCYFMKQYNAQMVDLYNEIIRLNTVLSERINDGDVSVHMRGLEQHKR